MIIRNPDFLSNEYLPEEILHREKEQKEISFAVKSFSDYGVARNLFIYGSTGVGKTLCVRYLCENASEQLRGMDYIYVNCWKDHTRMSVLNAIADHLSLVLPRRGIAVDEIYSRIEEKLVGSSKKLIVVLDEADRLVYSKYSKDSILYDLIRMGSKIMIIMISNDDNLPLNIDQRIRSSLMLGSIEFKKYSGPELRDIVRERAKVSFFPGSFDEDSIGLIAGIASKRGDARVALALLRLSVIIAEKEESKILFVGHVKAAKDEIIEFKQRDYDDEEKQIVALLRERGNMSSGEIYSALSSINERTLRNKLDGLVSSGVILKKEIRKGGGRSSEYMINEQST